MMRALRNNQTPDEIVANFVAAMGEAGLRPVEAIAHRLAQGELVRFRAEGDKRGRQNGWAILYLDGRPAGAFGHYRLGIDRQTWTAGQAPLSEVERAALMRHVERSRAASETRRQQDLARKRVQARTILCEAFDPFSTLTELLLRKRGLRLTPKLAEVLRHHPSCPFDRDEGGRLVRHPCMVAPLRHVRTNEILGIHRTALTEDARRLDRRALGAGFDGMVAIKLTPDEEICSALAVAEGIETALAVLEDAPWPLWAMGAAGGITRLPVLPGVETLTIFADNDPGGEGQAAARACAERWAEAGREVFIQTPRRAGADFNDLLSAAP